MPRTEPADPRALFAPLVENLAKQGKPLVRGTVTFGRGGFRFRTPEQAEQERKIEQIVASAQAEAQAKQQFPTAEEALKRDILSRITPLPTLRVSPTATPEQRNRLEEVFQKRLEKRADVAEMFGLTPRQQPAFQQVFSVDPTSGQVTPLGQVPRGGRVVTTPAVPLEKTTGVISSESALRSLNELRTMILDNPQALLTRGIPGIQGSRELDRLIRNLELEIVTARGGKQLTPSERQLIRQVFPNRLDALDALFRGDPSVIENKIRELEQKALDLIERIPTRGRQASSFQSPNQRNRSRAGAQLMQDAQGNRAYVYQDGRVEELHQ